MIAHRDIMKRYTILLLILTIMIVLLACGSPTETSEPTINVPTEVPSPNGDDALPDGRTTIEPTEEIPSAEEPGGDLSGDVPGGGVATPESPGDVGEKERNELPYIDLGNTDGTFSIEDNQQINSKDVFSEVSYAGGGAWFACTPPDNSPTFYFNDTEKENFRVEWQGNSFGAGGVKTCGWQSNEKVDFTVYSLLKEIVAQEVFTAQFDGMVYLNFGTSPAFPEINTPPGLYNFRLEAGSGSLEHNVYVFSPEEPTLYIHKNKLLLYNFHPDEYVEIFIYSDEDKTGLGKMSLIAWEESYVNSEGQLVLEAEEELPLCNYLLYVLGEFSGEIHISCGGFPTSPVIRSERAIQVYYQLINYENYNRAWEKLTDHFKDKFNCCASSGEYDFEGYTEWWNGVNSIDIGEIQIIEQDDNMVTLNIRLSYILDDGRTIEDPKPYIQLMWDEDINQWLFYDKW